MKKYSIIISQIKNGGDVIMHIKQKIKDVKAKEKILNMMLKNSKNIIDSLKIAIIKERLYQYELLKLSRKI